MAFPTLDEISELMGRIGLPKHEKVDEPFEEVGMIRTGAGTPMGPVMLSIDPVKEKGFIIIHAHVAMTPQGASAELQLEILQFLNHLNRQQVIGKFFLDQSDGEVILRSNHVMTDSDTLTEETLESLIQRTVFGASKVRADLARISSGEAVFNEVAGEVTDTDAPPTSPISDAELAELLRKLRES